MADSDAGDGTTSGLRWPAMVVAIVIVLLYAVLTLYLFWDREDASDAGRVAWERGLVIYNALAALAFAAAGALFGTQIERVNVASERARRGTVEAESRRLAAVARQVQGLLPPPGAQILPPDEALVLSNARAARAALDAALSQ